MATGAYQAKVMIGDVGNGNGLSCPYDYRCEEVQC
jgi:hypothetical protein